MGEMVITVEMVIMVAMVIIVEMVFVVVMAIMVTLVIIVTKVIMVKMVMVVAMDVMVLRVTIIMVDMVVRVVMVIMVIRTDRTRPDLTFKLDFPGNLCRAAFAILAMFSSKVRHALAPGLCQVNEGRPASIVFSSK